MIYAIQCGVNGPIKLGRAIDPKGRLRELQVAHFEKLNLLASQATFGDAEIERGMHEQCKSSSIRGEWFRPTEQVLAVVERMKQGVLAPQTMQEYAGAIARDWQQRVFKHNLIMLCQALKRLKGNGSAQAD